MWFSKNFLFLCSGKLVEDPYPDGKVVKWKQPLSLIPECYLNRVVLVRWEYLICMKKKKNIFAISQRCQYLSLVQIFLVYFKTFSSKLGIIVNIILHWNIQLYILNNSLLSQRLYKVFPFFVFLYALYVYSVIPNTQPNRSQLFGKRVLWHVQWLLYVYVCVCPCIYYYIII